VKVGRSWPWDACVDKALAGCEGEYVALVPRGMKLTNLWVEAPLHSLLRTDRPKEAVLLKDAGRGCWGALFRTEELLAARRRHPALTVRRSIEAEGLRVRKANVEEFPFLFDHTLKLAQAQEADGNYLQAARAYDVNQAEHDNALWMKESVAKALYQQGGHDAEALRICREINEQRPLVATLLLEARLLRRNDHVEEAIQSLRRARAVLDWTA